MGYDTYNSILNLSFLGLLFFIYVLRILFLFVLIIWNLINDKCLYIKTYKENLKRKLIFKELLVCIIEGYFELLISCYL